MHWFQFVLLVAAWFFYSADSRLLAREPKEEKTTSASVLLQIGKAGCTVDLDDAGAGTTSANGTLLISPVEPGDHYLHIDCAGAREMAFFISPAESDEVTVKPEMAIAGNEAAPMTPLEAAENRAKLNQSVQQAVRLRARGDLDQTVKLLREATRLDPENSDLHRELGITFLIAKDWPRARIEMLEAIRHDPQDADAHNGLGYALEKLGNLDGALKEYRIATHLDPDDSSYQQHYLDAVGKVAARQEAEQARKKR
ncbi:MAG: tetratricopeptide repeat protein [Deltaproteobacteria bacterium]